VHAVVRAHELVRTVILPAHGAFGAVTEAADAGVALGADADAVTDFDSTDGFGAYADSCANDFVADAAGVEGWALVWG
jgi:hypothetical protein